MKLEMLLLCAGLWQIVSKYTLYLIYTTATISSSSSNIHSSMTNPFYDDEVAIEWKEDAENVIAKILLYVAKCIEYSIQNIT